jgi:hypothetical protein
MSINIKDLVKGNTAKFVSYRDGNFLYQVNGFEFPIPLNDVAGATLLAEDKAIFFMRWIRRHVEQIEETENP